jgi:flagellar motor switch protein FliN
VAGSDDLLTPDEIEALMSAARGGQPAPQPAASRSAEPPPTAPASGPEQTLRQAEAHLAAALAPDLGGRKGPPAELGTPTPFAFDNLLDAPAEPGPRHPLSALEEVELDLRIELGRTELLIEEVLQLREGTVVPLDKLAGDPVDIFVNGRLIARGEVLVLNDNFCVRVAEILAPER